MWEPSFSDSVLGIRFHIRCLFQDFQSFLKGDVRGAQLAYIGHSLTHQETVVDDLRVQPIAAYPVYLDRA